MESGRGGRAGFHPGGPLSIRSAHSDQCPRPRVKGLVIGTLGNQVSVVPRSYIRPEIQLAGPSQFAIACPKPRVIKGFRVIGTLGEQVIFLVHQTGYPASGDPLSSMQSHHNSDSYLSRLVTSSTRQQYSEPRQIISPEPCMHALTPCMHAWATPWHYRYSGWTWHDISDVLLGL